MTPADLAPALPAGGIADGGPVAPARAAPSRVRARRRLVIDRIATLAVRAGGLGIIGSILAILVFIVGQVLPMLSAASIETTAVVPLPGADVRALLADEYGTHVAALDLGGQVRVLRLRDQQVIAEASILPPDTPDGRLVAAAVRPETTLLTG